MGSSCAICLNEKSDAEDGGAWVQLPCEHVLHRMCFRELVSCLDQMRKTQWFIVFSWGPIGSLYFFCFLVLLRAIEKGSLLIIGMTINKSVESVRN